MKNLIPLSLLKSVSDMNHENNHIHKFFYSIDVEKIEEEYPEMTEMELYTPAVYRGTHYQLCFKNPGRGLWLSQDITEDQLCLFQDFCEAPLDPNDEYYEEMDDIDAELDTIIDDLITNMNTKLKQDGTN